MYELMTGAVALELSHQWPDAVGQHLADMGCEVIMVEPPGGGRQTRDLWVRDGLGMCHSHWNRSKKSLAVDVRTEGGRALLLELVARVDLLLCGLRPGAMERWGLDRAALSAVNPSLVHVALSGWGNSGPYRRLATNGAGFDGFAGLQPPDVRADGLAQLPEMPGTRGEVHYGAVVGSLYAAMCAAAAWGQRQRTGKGAWIDVAEADAAVAMRFDHLFWKLNFDLDDGRPQPWPASARTRYQYYRTRDDRTVFLSPAQPVFWRRFCERLGRPDLLDSRVDTEAERIAIAAIARTKTRAEWVQWCLDNDVPCAPVYDQTGELLEDPQFQARDLVAEVQDPGHGPVKLFSSPAKVEGQQFTPRPAPALGEHTDALLARFGVDADRIAGLRRAGVVA
ncbi:MAG: CaiB/BaiF CoA transferase family protein [Gammaproteobacteria bacterium]